jgi:4-methyl-5(b-hydroxyethyl)-thiazole monophosphate biosynthesis
MKKVLLLLANGFEIYEASIIMDVIEWNIASGDNTIELITCGLRKEIKSNAKVKFSIDLTIDEVNVDEYAALVVPAGFESHGFFDDAYNEKFLELIKEFNRKNKIIASICVGALPLGKSGVLKNKRGTTFYGKNRQNQLKEFGVDVINESIVIEGNIITSLNPATGIDVAFKLLELLTTKEKSDNIKKIMGFKK